MSLRMLMRALVPLALFPSAVAAQTVRGAVVERGSNTPIPGVLVALVGADGAVRAEVLSGPDGRFRVETSTPGSYTLRGERVGYRPLTSPAIQLASGQTVEYAFEVAVERLVLPAITAGAGRRCTTRSDPGLEVAVLWSEARKALRSATYTSAQFPYHYRVARRVRQLDPQTLLTESMREETGESVKESPFVTVGVERLAEKGYVEQQGDTLLFHAPDAAILLSDAFLDSHCFRGEAEDARHRGMVGLAFSPIEVGRKVDVQGVLWMDAASAELRALEYAYVGGPFATPSEDGGGRVEFRRLPSGGWIVSRWRIRFPSTRAMPQSQYGRVASSGLLTEESGEVIEIRTTDGAPVALAALASVRGVVFDSTRARPLGAARVQLAGTQYAATADSAGRFTLDGIAEGVYSLTFTHPRLDSLRYTPEPVRVVAVPSQAESRDLGIPPLARVLTASCSAGEGNGSLAGVVMAGGAPAAGIPVRASWQRPGEAGDSLRAVAVSDDAGVYRFCDLPARVPLRVAALAAGAASGDVRLDAGLAALHDLSVGAAPSARAGAGQRGRVVLRMVDAANARPIVGATVRLGGGIPEAVSDRRGLVTVADVPAGSYGVEFRHPTYGTGTTRVTVHSGLPTEAEIRVPRRPVTLEPLVVTARRVLPGAFNEDRRARRLDIFTHQEIERMPAARNVGDVVARLSGVVVKQGENGDICVESRRYVYGKFDPGQCEAVQLVMDDMVVGVGTEFAATIPLATIESVILLKPVEAFARYGYIGQKGVLLIYTRGNGPTAGQGN